MVRKAIGAGSSTAFGFSLIEVIISMFLTVIVMGAVYGLLLKGQQAFDREPGVVDVQQSARSALAMVSADVLQAGTSLPPEFPAFTPPTLGGQPTGTGDQGTGNPGTNPDVIEIVGNIQNPGQQQQLPEPFTTFDPSTGTVTLAGSQTNFLMNDLVVVYNNEDGVDPLKPPPIWWMGMVQTATPGASNASLTVVAHPRAPTGYTYNSGITAASISGGFVTKASVVRYVATLQSGGVCTAAAQNVNDPCVLRRSVDFGPLQPVGTVSNFKVTYSVVTITGAPPQAPTAGDLPGTIVSSVNLQVAARSLQANQFIQKTFSTVTNPRNLTSAVGIRTALNPTGPAYQ